MIEILTVPTPSLGDRSYLATDGTVALVVDPQRDIDRILALAASLGVAVTHVFDTHLHNDYLSGGLALARATGAAYHVNVADRVAFDRTGVRDRDVVEVGPAMRVHVIATPGHTFTHLSYALEDAVTAGAAVAVFSGGSSCCTGRPAGPTCSGPSTRPAWPRPSTGRPGGWPRCCPRRPRCTPRTGSAASARPGRPSGGGSGSTIGDERRWNPALTQDEDRFVAGLLAGLDDYPAYYARMAPANAAGPGQPSLAPPAPASAAQVAARIAGSTSGWSTWRSRRVFAAGHVPGSLSFEYGETASRPTWAGRCRPARPLTLIADDPRAGSPARSGT